MADLKVGTTIGGSPAWHQGNLPLVPSGVKILYKGKRIYSEADKPTANELNVVSRDGDTMSQRLTIATTNDYPLAFNSTDSGPSKILFQRANTTRMVMGMDAAGNFQLSSNDASGTHIGYGLQIWNSSLDASFGGSIQMPDNKSWYIGKGGNPVLRDHNNGNVSLAALPNASGGSGDLYLGYNGTGMVTNTVRLESAMTWKSVRTLVNADGYILRSAMDNPYFNQTEADNRFLRRNVNTATDSYLLSKSVDYTDGSVSIPAGYSGFFRNNSSNDFRGLTIHVAHPSYSNGAYSRGITFDYGSGTSLYTYGFDSAGVKRSNIKIYTEADKPTPGELGALPATANAVSASKLATGRRISLSGDATGSVVFDGSGDVTLPVTVLNDSHTHNNYVVKAGDTMTGNLIVNAAISANELKAGSDTHKARIVHSGGAVWYQGGSIATDQPNNVAMSGYSGTNLDLFQIRMGDGRSPVVRWGSTDYRIYHEGNRPSELVSISLSGKSCNNAVESGTYSIFGGTTDTPFGTGPSGSTMQVSKWGGGAVQQMFFSHNADRVFVRRLEGGVWKSWFELYSTSNKPSATDVGALPVNGNAVSATRLQTARLISGVPFDGTSNITITAANVGAYSKTETYSKGEIDSQVADAGVKRVIINKPSGITANFYVPVVLTNMDGRESVYISTKPSGGSDPMNNCSFNGIIRAGGWSDKGSYVTGQFSIFHESERALHSVYGGTEGDGFVAFFVHEKAFPITVVVDGRVGLAAGASITAGTSVFTASADPATGNTKATRLAQWSDGSGFYQGSSKTPSWPSINYELDKKFDKAGGTLTGDIFVDRGNTTESKVGVRRDGRTTYLYDSGSSVGIYSSGVNGQGSLALVSRIISSGDVVIGGSASRTVIAGSGTLKHNTADVYTTANKPSASDVNAYSKTETDDLLNKKLNLTGGTLTGNLTIVHNAPQIWMDESDNSSSKFGFVVDGATIRLNKDSSGGLNIFKYQADGTFAINNPVSMSAQGTHGSALTRKDYVDSRVATGLPLTGGTLTGNLTVNGTITAGGRVAVAEILSDGWLRTKGAHGWYNETYGGGWHMSDSTWIRSYGGRKLHIANSDSNAIDTVGGVTAGGTITAGGSLIVGSSITVNGGYQALQSAGNTLLEFHTPGVSAAMIYKGPEGNLRFVTSNGSGGETKMRMQVDVYGNVTVAGAIDALAGTVQGKGVYDSGNRVYSASNPIPDSVILRSVTNGGGNMDIGSYAMITVKANLGTIGPGTVVQGTQINFSNAEGTNLVACNYGTWRLMGVSRAQSQNGDGWGSWNVTLAQRIA